MFSFVSEGKKEVRHKLIIYALISHLFFSILEEKKVIISYLTWLWNIILIVIIIFYLMSLLYIHFIWI